MKPEQRSEIQLGIVATASLGLLASATAFMYSIWTNPEFYDNLSKLMKACLPPGLVATALISIWTIAAIVGLLRPDKEDEPRKISVQDDLLLFWLSIGQGGLILGFFILAWLDLINRN